jgi:hypothetical protein
VKFDFALTSTNTYALSMTPLSDPSLAFSQTGKLTTNLPISWVNFRCYNTASSGPTDTADNFGISSMTIQGLALGIQRVGTNVLLSWPAVFSNSTLLATTNLAVPNWSPAPTNASGVVNGQNVVTNTITGSRNFYRLQFTP